MNLPEGSLYFWMYTQGLKHVPLPDIQNACAHAGRELRKKDEENYWNGWYRSDLYQRDDTSIWQVACVKQQWHPGLQELFDYPAIPFEYWNWPQNRWVPCSKDNKPLIKWGNGCMTLPDACAMSKQVYLAENNKGVGRIIIDCDGDHGDKLDLETIQFLGRYIDTTHTLYKEVMVCDTPGYETTGITTPVSFHLSFRTERIIPTMHFPKAGIDIIGNKENSLRYIKTKKHNGKPCTWISEQVWNEVCEYIKYREGR